MKLSKRKKQISIGFVAIVFFLSFNTILTCVSAFSIQTDGLSDNRIESCCNNPTEGWLEDQHDTPTGTRFTLFDEYGGFWADAEKSPGDDGGGDPNPNNAGEDDDLLCWAATTANILEWTGWGYVKGMINKKTDDFFQYYKNHVTDYGSLVNYGIDWWFSGTLTNHGANWASEDVSHTGFWNDYTVSDYMGVHNDDSTALQYIHLAQAYGCAVGLHIRPVIGSGGHAVTCWGVNYNESLDYDSKDCYLGVWLTDSDSHKGSNSPDDVLRYYEVEYDTANDYYYLPNYGSGWRIDDVIHLRVFPGADRPTAVAKLKSVSNIWGFKVFNFDASSSSDPSNDKLKYRWDFNGDGKWDTKWLVNPKRSHIYRKNAPYFVKVYLEVFDGRLRDIGTKIVQTRPIPIRPIPPIPVIPI